MKASGGIILAVIAMSLAAETRAAPHVVSVYPQRQRIDAPANGQIRVVFSENIDPATLDAVSFRVFGRWSGPATGVISVNSETVTFTPSVPFFAGEYVTVSLSKAITNTLGQPMPFGHAWSYWIKSGAGSLDLTYVTRYTTRKGNETWVQSYGSYGGDLDHDGWSDLFIPNENSDDVRIFMNNGGSFAGGFTAEKPTGMNGPSPNKPSDFDNDGDIDVVVGNFASDRINVMFGDGTGHFPNSLELLTGAQGNRGIGVLDLNGDGWDDIVSASRVGSDVSMFINHGDGTFAARVPLEVGVARETSLAVADANNDGIMDVFVGNYDAPRYITVCLGDGNGGLVPQTPVPTYGRPWMLAIGDLDGDGNVDVFSAAADGNGIGIHYGDGAGAISAATSLDTGQYPLAVDAGDIDGDGDLELVGSSYNWANWTIWENAGGGSFIHPRTLEASSAASCATLHDRDNDGDIDLTGIDEVDDWVYIFDNDPAPTHVSAAPAAATMSQNHPNPFNPWTTIRFELEHAGMVDLSVYDAAGARVATIASGSHDAGAYDVRWNGTDAKGAGVASGVYFYRLRANGTDLTRKMMLLK